MLGPCFARCRSFLPSPRFFSLQGLSVHRRTLPSLTPFFAAKKRPYLFDQTQRKRKRFYTRAFLENPFVFRRRSMPLELNIFVKQKHEQSKKSIRRQRQSAANESAFLERPARDLARQRPRIRQGRHEES